MTIITLLIILILLILSYNYIKSKNKPIINKNIKNKYIIYKSSGGLTHYLKGLITAIDIALKQNRILLIDNNSESMNKLKFGDFFTFRNKFNYIDNDYTLLPDNIIYKDRYTKTDIQKCISKYESGNKYTILGENTNMTRYNQNDKLIIYSGPGKHIIKDILDYIYINNNIMNKLKKYKINNKYIGIHYRNTDIKNNIDSYINKIKNISYDNINTIYLASDDSNALNNFKSQLPNMNIISYVTIASKDCKSIHININTYEEAYKQMFETLLDMFMLFNSTYFIPSNNSGLSNFVICNIKSDMNIFNMTSSTIII